MVDLLCNGLHVSFMRLKILLCFVTWVLFSAGSVLLAQEADSEEKVIPTEVSQPPYEVGDLVYVQGYYIEREDQTSINLRFIENKIRIYWIDEDGLIAEPEAHEGNIRFKGSVRGKPFNGLSLLNNEPALGAAGLITAPHIFNVILNLKSLESGALETYTFRYLSSMDEKKQPPALEGTEDGDS